MNAALIEASGLGWRRGGREILADVDLRVEAGRILTIVGPNGAGKTTLLRLLMGLQKPTAGRVRRVPGLTVGYVPQSFSVDPIMPLPVWRLMGLTRPAARDAIAAALAEVGAEALIDADVGTLSGGEQRRVLLARAILRRPRVLFLDEPTQGVDFAGEIALYRLIAALRERLDCAVVMVSHDLHVVMAATDQVICLDGRVCCAGRPEAVREDPNYRRLFGRAAADVALYHHDHPHTHGPEGAACPLPPFGGAAGER